MAITHNYLDTYNSTFQSKGSYIRYIFKVMTEKRSSTISLLSVTIARIKYSYYLTSVLIDIYCYFIWFKLNLTVSFLVYLHICNNLIMSRYLWMLVYICVCKMIRFFGKLEDISYA